MKDQFSVDNKVDVLKTALEERYSALRIIRTRVQDICLWSLGLLVGASAWVFQSDKLFVPFESTVIIMFSVLAYVILRFVYFADLQKGFKGQQRSAAKLEKLLHLYTPGYYKEEETVYDAPWALAGTEKGEGKFFRVNYFLLQFGLAVLVATVLLRTWWC